MTASAPIALVGCGAIAEAYHLPALSEILSTEDRVILVDPNEGRLSSMSQRFGALRTVTRHEEICGDVAGAILAVPHHLHHRLALDFLGARAHVLCEKPLATTAAEVDELLDAARRAGRALCVNNNRRLFPSMREVARILHSGELGTPLELHFTIGEIFEWPAVQGAYFGPAANERGVLLDIGAHVVDLVCWWLGRPLEVDSYQDDAQGGTEAVAELTFKAGECRGRITLSWLSRLDNGYRVRCEKGVVGGGVYDLDRIWIEDAAGRRKDVQIKGKAGDRARLAEDMIRNFVAVVDGSEEPLIPADDVATSIRVIDSCYRTRRRFDMPWIQPDQDFLRA